MRPNRREESIRPRMVLSKIVDVFCPVPVPPSVRTGFAQEVYGDVPARV